MRPAPPCVAGLLDLTITFPNRRSLYGARWMLGLWLVLMAISMPATVSASAGSPTRSRIEIRPINTVTVRTLNVDDGLPQNTVHAIAQTSDGYLWIATWEGLARFDGAAFEVFDTSTSPEIASGGVRSLLAGADGELWLGQSENGVTRYERGRWTGGLRDPELANDQVLALLADPVGRVYAGTADHGVMILDGNEIRRLTVSGNRVLGMALDPQQRLLLATHLGLQRVAVDGSGLQDFGGGQTRVVTVSDSGRILVGGDAGLQVLIDDRLQQIVLPAALANISITAMAVDHRDRLWFGTQSDGLFRATFAADGGIAWLERLGSDEGLPNPRVLSLMFDRENSLWVGTNGGLTQVVETAVERIGVAQGLDDPFARVTIQGGDGDIYIGTSGGLFRFSGGELAQQFNATELGSNSVTALTFDASGALWVGTYDSGVVVLRNGKVVRALGRQQGLAQLSIRTLFFDSHGVLWIGTSEGLLRYDNGQIKLIDLFNKSSPDFILSLAEAPDGSLWVGTAIGLAQIRRDGETVIHQPSNGYPALDTFDIRFEPDGSAWLATDGGLVRMENGSFRAVSRLQGMPSDTLFRILVDASGAFWLTSNRGLARVERAQIDRVLDGSAEKAGIVLLTEESGLSATQCNGGTQPAGMLADDGSLWIPTANGVSRIDPRDFPIPAQPSVPMVVQQVRVDGVPTTLPPTLHAGARRIDFDLSGLAYVNRGQLRYRHWLQGFDKGFSSPVAGADIGYTNLPPGNYVLHAAARIGDQGTDGPPLQIAFEVKATLLQSRWFQVLLAALTLLVGAVIYATRVAGLQRNQRQLAAMVDARTIELKERATALDAANRDKARLVEQLRHQAMHDSLTGLPNRLYADQYLIEQYAQARQSDATLIVALLDVDNFKQINDAHGHQAGDRVLVALGALLQDLEDLWCARVGGEEFLLICSTHETACIDRFESLRVRIATSPIRPTADTDVHITVSIGWSDAARFASVEKALAEADRQLYRAKGAGRNRVRPQPPGSARQDAS